MNLKQYYLTENTYFKRNDPMPRIDGIIIHETAAENPTLRRYIAPDDGLLGPNSYDNDWNRSGKLCVHAFIGQLKDGTIATYQTLPWDIKGGHAGDANTTYIGIELCNGGDDAVYFDAAYKEYIEVVAYLCEKFNLDVENVIGHYEAGERGIGSHNDDPEEYFAKFGRTMDGFREDVRAEMNKKRTIEVEESVVKVGDKKAIPALLIDGITYVPLREVIATTALQVTWSPEDGAKIEL